MSPGGQNPAPVPPAADQGPTPAPLSGDPILRTVSRAVFALVLLFALLLLWRGHNAPGGGFIAGLMTACALILHRVAYGHTALRLDPALLLVVGGSLAIAYALIEVSPQERVEGDE
jgi:multicomponent Na+:H+ antiporter subunit B